MKLRKACYLVIFVALATLTLLTGCVTPVISGAVLELPIPTNAMSLKATDPEISEAVEIVESILHQNSFERRNEPVLKTEVGFYRTSRWYYNGRLFMSAYDHPKMFVSPSPEKLDTVCWV